MEVLQAHDIFLVVATKQGIFRSMRLFVIKRRGVLFLNSPERRGMLLLTATMRCTFIINIESIAKNYTQDATQSATKPILEGVTDTLAYAVTKPTLQSCH